jgi:DNA-binding winged helix-turn-helix (wHTH) protein
MSIIFLPEQLSIQYGREIIELLPKEYALFHYLYLHSNRLCTREQLLNAVWPMEYPTDRTIDDHIYRLRKKLKQLDYFLSIETIHGKGYRLLYTPSVSNPLVNDEDTKNSYTMLLNKYHLFGQGEAMQLLAAHQSILGVHLDEEKQLFLEFINGNFPFFLTSDLPFPKRAFYLIGIYWNIQLDSTKALAYAEKALARRILPKAWHEDTKFSRISLYIEIGELEQAERLLKSYETYVIKPEMKGFQLFFHNKELLLAIVTGQNDKVTEKIKQIEMLLTSFPYLREQGIFLVLKGLWLLCQEQASQAETSIQEGLRTLRNSHFFPHLIYGIKLLRQFSFLLPESMAKQKKKLHQLWEEISTIHNLPELVPLLVRQLDAYL